MRAPLERHSRMQRVAITEEHIVPSVDWSPRSVFFCIVQRCSPFRVFSLSVMMINWQSFMSNDGPTMALDKLAAYRGVAGPLSWLGNMRNLLWLIVLLPSLLSAQVRFTDDFEAGDLSGWDLLNPEAIRVIDSTSAAHGNVLELQADDAVVALIRDSDQWGAVRMEGELFFPSDDHNYLAFVYHFMQFERRTDFGAVYLKGNGSYIRANPWRDMNVSRLLYEEYLTPLQGEAAIQIGRWHTFKMEVMGKDCHIYIDDMITPKITFELYEHTSGQVGFNSRVAGSSAWIDNIRVTSIERLQYDGPNIPDITYQRDSLITDWEVIGPVAGATVAIERSGPGPRVSDSGQEYTWRSFETDSRGAVISGRVSEFRGGRPVAYFRTTIVADEPRQAVLHFSSTDELALWVNGRFQGYVYRKGYVDDGDWNAWYDFGENPDHRGSRNTVDLKEGENHIVIRTYNGQFASGGFFAKWE